MVLKPQILAACSFPGLFFEKMNPISQMLEFMLTLDIYTAYININRRAAAMSKPILYTSPASCLGHPSPRLSSPVSLALRALDLQFLAKRTQFPRPESGLT
jgi:hypothetical protein